MLDFIVPVISVPTCFRISSLKAKEHSGIQHDLYDVNTFTYGLYYNFYIHLKMIICNTQWYLVIYFFCVFFALKCI